jgi:hypothetical protein
LAKASPAAESLTERRKATELRKIETLHGRREREREREREDQLGSERCR